MLACFIVEDNVLKPSPLWALSESLEDQDTALNASAQVSGLQVIYFSLVFGKVSVVHQFVVKLIAVTSLNRMWQGPRAFQSILHRFMIIPMFHKSDFGVPLVSLLPCPFFVGLGVGSPWGSPLALFCLCWGGHHIPCLFFVAGCVCGPSQKM